MFLSKYPDVFILNAQDEVLLKEFENYYNEQVLQQQQGGGNTSGGTGKNLHAGDRGFVIDKKRIVDLIEFYANCLNERGPMLVEQLFCAGNAKFDELTDMAALADYFKTPGDLATFFKMYPQCFQVTLSRFHYYTRGVITTYRYNIIVPRLSTTRFFSLITTNNSNNFVGAQQPGHVLRLVQGRSRVPEAPEWDGVSVGGADPGLGDYRFHHNSRFVCHAHYSAL